MCNQTEMWKDIDAYDEKAARGEVPPRGVIRTLPKKQMQKLQKFVFKVVREEGPVGIFRILERTEKECPAYRRDGDVKDAVWYLIDQGKIEMTSNRKFILR